MYGNLTNEIYIYTVKHDNSEHPFNEFKLIVISNCPGHYKRTLLYSDNIKYLQCPGKREVDMVCDYINLCLRIFVVSLTMFQSEADSNQGCGRRELTDNSVHYGY